MTLILGCITSNYVIQVSDRRLTWATGPNAGKVVDDDSNKALVICNAITVAYTGLAQIGRLRTDEWLLQVAGGVLPYNPQRVCDEIALRATAEFKNISLPNSLKRHAFLVCGWARFNRCDAPLEPFLLAISNALDHTWQWQNEASKSFGLFGIRLNGQPCWFASVGQNVPMSVRKVLARRVRKYVNRERGPEAYIQLLANSIRDTSTANSLVGKNLMAISLPKEAASRSQGLAIPLRFPMDPKEPVALYLPEFVTEPILYGPNYTCNGLNLAEIWVRASDGPR